MAIRIVSRLICSAGYEVIPIYPREDTILGQPVYRTVTEIEQPVDLINVFRRSEELPDVVADILKSPHPNKPPVWFQLDCVHAGAFADLVKAGHTVISDECLMVEHARLVRG
ncbi:MAG: CoA-binding protein [Vicinamibacteria bacterium]